ncbi:hypothetical protein GCM10022291_02830 [Postechiella marina]|uniref:Uncharacterized protein n=2 Tax=Postechiella marina TaxID=943941 RepID=A0ABP8BZR2_9FLAO
MANAEINSIHKNTNDAVINTHQIVKSLFFSSTKTHNKSKSFIEYIDFEDIEENNEEESSNKPLSFGSITTAIFYAQKLMFTSCKVQENTLYIKYFFSDTSLRLHAKFQVFII